MELLSVPELANLLKVKPGTIHTWLFRGVDIPHIRVESVIRFRREAIEGWLLQKEKDRKKRNFEI
jgi:excisionase family DNA binding protein